MSEKQQQKLLEETHKLVQEEKWDAAIAKWSEIIALPPDSDTKAKAYSNRGGAKSKMGDHMGAIADYDRALEINPQYTIAYNNRGSAKIDLGDYKGAIADLDRALEINPQHAQAYNNRGNAKDNMGDHEGAIADYDQALKIDPQHIQAYSNRGNAKDKMGDHEGAIADYDQALKINPQYAGAYNNRGNAKDNMGDHEGAIADYDQALKINPQLTDAYSNRGNTKANMGDYEGAIADHNQALKINPNYQPAIHNRAVARTLQAAQKKHQEIETKLQAQLQEQQEQFDRERQEQLQNQQEQLRKQQEQFDRERQEQLRKQREQQEQFDREQEEAQKERQEAKERRDSRVRIIHSDEYKNTMDMYETQARERGKWVWGLSGVLGVLAVIVYGYITCFGMEEWQAAQSPMAMRVFSPLSLFPFILMGTLALSPLAWVVRMLNRDKHKYWVLREEAAANLNLLRIIETGHQKREDLWLQLFDHYDKRGSANLIADWERTDTSGGNSPVSVQDIVSLLSNKGSS